MEKKIIFVTGTDTGAGKTVLTAMLLAFLRSEGVNAFGMKPFCSGSRADARLLHSLQREAVTLDDVNPFYFAKPLAPAAAATGRKKISLAVVLSKIRALARRCDLLVVEGVGGVMVPLGAGFTVRDLIQKLDCETFVACPNRLGAINHALLTVEALRNSGVKQVSLVMVGVEKPDISAASNPKIIRQMIPETPVFCLPFVGKRASFTREVKNNVKYLKKTLAQLLGRDNLSAFFRCSKEIGRRNLLTIRFKCLSVFED